MALWGMTAAIVLAGCGGTSLLQGTSTTATTRSVTVTRGVPPSADPYLSQLSDAQARLAGAERRLPKRVATPAALAAAINRLASAIGALARDLTAIRPPRPVAALHARLVATMRTYAAALAAAAGQATSAGGEVSAANALVSATNQASAAFLATVAQIDRKLLR